MSQHIQTSHPGSQFSHILSQFYEHLHIYQQLGFEGIPKGSQHAAPSAPPSLEQLEQLSQRCRSCSLHAARAHIVFGAGNPHARLMFIGGVPSIEDDRQGLPFSGEDGDLLTRIIEAIKLRREDVYLCNIMKCRPASERRPEHAEVAECLSLLRRQIECVQPKIICALGSLAAQSLLETQETLAQLRGRFHRYQGILLMPTYHPAHLLEHPEDKRQVWNDMQMIQKAYHDDGSGNEV